MSIWRIKYFLSLLFTIGVLMCLTVRNIYYHPTSTESKTFSHPPRDTDILTDSSFHQNITTLNERAWRRHAPLEFNSALDGLTNHLKARATPRDPSAKVIEATLKRGKRLVASMKSDPVVTSKWQSWEQLSLWGWDDTSKEFHVPHFDSAGTKEIIGTSKSEGVRLTHSGKDPKRITSTKENVDGKMATVNFPPTKAEYTNVYFPDKGTIIALKNEGPADQVTKKETSKKYNWNPKTDRIPELRQLSDIWWLSWLHLHASKSSKTPIKPPPITDIIRREITNQDTKNLLHYIVRHQFPNNPSAQKGEAPPWKDRVTLRPSLAKPKDENGKEIDMFALMVGSTSVWAAAYLCLQHGTPGALGHQEIKSVTVWQDDPDGFGYYPNLWIQIGPVADAAGTGSRGS